MTEEIDPGVLPPHTLASIEVEGLFGRFNYRLAPPVPGSFDHSRLTILYGDNGSGKTTILRLLFHLLSQSAGRGHKTHIVRIPFRRFAVTFSNGTNVEAVRPEANSGPYTLRIHSAGDLVYDYNFKVTDGRIRAEDNEGLSELSEELHKQVPLDLYYVGDDRKLESDNVPRSREPRRHVRIDARGRRITELIEEPNELRPYVDLGATLERVVYWLRNQAINASALGSQNSNFVYADILKQIATPSLFQGPSRPAKNDVMNRLHKLSDRNERYQEFGLVPAFDYGSILEATQQVSAEREETYYSILVPFLDGLEARLNALETLYVAVDSFAEAINSFYEDKTVSITLGHGVQIETRDGRPIQGDWLSSGERQILLLLANAIFAREREAIFIIDEPELSLNMKWQRKLLEALLTTSRGTSTQFILATHSFELMTGARERVVQLVPSSEPPQLLERVADIPVAEESDEDDDL